MTDKSQATFYLSLYLLNLLLLPGLAFLVFVWHWWRSGSKGPLTEFYGRFVWCYSLLAGLLLMVLPLASALLWFNSEYFWLWAITLWVTTHGVLVIWGAIALAASMAGGLWVWLLPPLLRPEQ